MKLPTLVFTILLLLHLPVVADVGTAAPDSKTILLIAGPKERLEIDRLRDTIDAHMTDLGAEVIVKAVLDMPTDLETQLDVARALLQEESALAAVWIEYEFDMLMLMVKDQTSEQILKRPVVQQVENPDQIYDAAASMVRAALTPWFVVEEKETPKPKIVIEKPRETVVSPPPRPEMPTPRKPVQFWLRAAYVFVANLDGPLSNGGAIGAGAFLFRRLEIGVDLRILQAAQMNIQELSVRLFRLPVTLHAALVFDTGPVSLGVEAGLTIDIARVLGADETAAPASIQRMRFGFSPMGLLRYSATDWLSIDLRAGVDIYTEPYHYLWDDQIVFTNGKIQPTVGLYISFFFPRRAEEMTR